MLMNGLHWVADYTYVLSGWPIGMKIYTCEVVSKKSALTDQINEAHLVLPDGK